MFPKPFQTHHTIPSYHTIFPKEHYHANVSYCANVSQPQLIAHRVTYLKRATRSLQTQSGSISKECKKYICQLVMSISTVDCDVQHGRVNIEESR